MDRRLLQTVADTCQQHTCRPLILPLLQKETKAATQMVDSLKAAVEYLSVFGILPLDQQWSL